MFAFADDKGGNRSGLVELGVGTPPTITISSPITPQQGSLAAVFAIAIVNDVETPANNLTVTASSIPAGITITSITNNNGAISASIAASCTATVGANTVTLTVTDDSGATVSGNLTINVTANTPPSLGAYPSSTATLGESKNLQPSTLPKSKHITIGTGSSFLVNQMVTKTNPLSGATALVPNHDT